MKNLLSRYFFLRYINAPPFVSYSLLPLWNIHHRPRAVSTFASTQHPLLSQRRFHFRFIV